MSDNATAPRDRARWLVVLGTLELAVSVALLLIAATTPTRLPRWGGPVDVTVALSLVVTLALLRGATSSRVAVVELRNTQTLMTILPPAAFVGLWLAQNHLIWNTLLPGLAWRSFVVASVIPLALATLRSPSVR